jgi:DNA-directed RNA polymerase subunit RPC12/RpoP
MNRRRFRMVPPDVRYMDCIKCDKKVDFKLVKAEPNDLTLYSVSSYYKCTECGHLILII